MILDSVTRWGRVSPGWQNPQDQFQFYFLCTQEDGTIELNEHEDLAWVEKKDFDKYDFAEGDGNILALL